MTIGSTASIAWAFEQITSGKCLSLSPLARLSLILIADQMGMGAAKVDLSKLAFNAGAEDPAHVLDAISDLTRGGHIRMSAPVDFNSFIALPIATDLEIANVRQAINCNWPFLTVDNNHVVKT